LYFYNTVLYNKKSRI